VGQVRAANGASGGFGAVPGSGWAQAECSLGFSAFLRVYGGGATARQALGLAFVQACET